jgi:hypothetical protein
MEERLSESDAHARGLLMAVLGDACRTPELPGQILTYAAALGIDPLAVCAHRFQLGDETVYRRAAEWANLAFSELVPALFEGSLEVVRLDHLSDVRAFAGRLFDRDVTFYAPRFRELIAMARSQEADDGFRRGVCIVTPRAMREAVTARMSDALLDEARQRLTRRWPHASADLDLPQPVRITFLVFFLLVTTLVAMAPFLWSEVLFPVVAILILVPAALRFAAVLDPVPPRPKPELLSNAELPLYSVLIPLRDEAAMVPQLRRALSALDYPPEKLDIKFVVEERSPETIEAVRAVLADPRFELVIVPESRPHTKPKALNFALPLVRGECVVVYDAEDIPDPGQLRIAASALEADPGLDCVQAELVIDNAEENALTAMFAAEYAGLFGVLLPFLGRRRLPMPLGGTSNHFRTTALRELGHWDAFNVTEDADLGIRLSRLRYRTDTLDTETSEEAPISFGAWMKQRTRWIKGWMRPSSDFRVERISSS